MGETIKTFASGLDFNKNVNFSSATKPTPTIKTF